MSKLKSCIVVILLVSVLVAGCSVGKTNTLALDDDTHKMFPIMMLPMTDFQMTSLFPMTILTIPDTKTMPWYPMMIRTLSLTGIVSCP